jgi:hypothetical protein
VAVNRCFGGFGLSEAGYRLYAARKGLTLYPENEGGFTTWWIVPPDDRPVTGDEWYKLSDDERAAANDAYDRCVLYSKDMSRTDPDLIAVIEQLGPAASSDLAKLEVVEIPADVEWHIDEYDGLEHVAENHRTW